MEHDIVGHVLGKVELCAWDSRERAFDHFPHDLSDRFRSVECAIEVPAAEVQLLGYVVQLFVGKGVLRVGVLFSIPLRQL